MAALVLFAQIVGLQGGAKVQTTTVLQSIDVTPLSTVLNPGQSYTVTATGNFTNPNFGRLREDEALALENRSLIPAAQNLTSSCVWTSSNTSVAVIGPKTDPQRIDAVGPGIVTISCRVGSISGTSQLTVANLVITPTTIPNAIVQTPYSVTLTTTGGTPPYTFSITTGAPQLTTSGFTFTAAGALAGTPTVAGTYGFSVQATDSATPPNIGSQGFVLIVNAGGGPNRVAALPIVWAKPHEADLPSPCNASNNCYQKYIRTDNSGDFACTPAGLQASMDQWAATPPNQWWEVIVDDGLSPNGRCDINFGTSTGWVWKAKSTGFPTGFIVYHSAHPNPPDQIVCTRQKGTQIAQDPSPRNVGCTTTPGIDDIQHMWRLRGNSTNSQGNIITTLGQISAAGEGPSHIVAADMDISPGGANLTQPVFLTICDLNGGTCPSGVPPTPASIPSHVGVVRSYIHGDFNDQGLSALGMRVTNAIVAGCTLCWFEWNYFEGLALPAGEGHIFALTNANPGIKIAHNFVEGSAISYMMGGGIPINRATPSDTEIRQNVFTTNPATIINGKTNVACNGRIGLKNKGENKLGIRILVNGNVYENSSECGQSGQGPTINVRSCSTNCDHFTAVITDFTFSNNIMRHLVNGVMTDPRAAGPGSGATVSLPMRRLNVINNLAYDISAGGWNGENRGGPAFFIQHAGSGFITWTCQGSRNSAGTISTLTCASKNPPWDSRTLTDVGDPVRIFNCPTTSFNTPGGVIGPPALPGTNGLEPNGTTVVYANPGPPNEVTLNASPGWCNLSNTNGLPFESMYRHNTWIGSGTSLKGPAIVVNSGPIGTFQRNALVQDEIYAVNGSWLGLVASGTLDGRASMALGYDLNTLTFNHELLTGRTIGRYPSFDIGTETAAGIANSTVWSAASVVCAGATADATCVGFHGMMNGGAFQFTSANPLVDFKLDPSSLYHAGNLRQASDGTDLGVDMNKLIQAMTETTYSGCAPGACGTGPNPD